MFSPGVLVVMSYMVITIANKKESLGIVHRRSLLRIYISKIRDNEIIGT
jgi:hypothetical protein